MNASVRAYVRKQVPGIADKVLAQVRPCINADSRKQRDADIPVCHSKLGGRPDVPQGFEWPVADGECLAGLSPKPISPNSGLLRT